MQHMLRLFYYFYMIFIIGYIISCSSPLFKITLPPEVGNTFRSDKIVPHYFSKTGATVMEYIVEQDSIIFAEYGDTTLTFGFVFPLSKMVATHTKQKRVFANERLRYQMYYDTKEVYSSSKSHSLLSDIILPENNDAIGYDKDRTNITSYHKYFKGYMLCLNEKDTAFYAFEQTRMQK
jgi:hypothetical protein